jgi:hypothetical protein
MNQPSGCRRSERGQIGGIEVIPFGLLVFVAGALLIGNAWAVVDAKFATEAGAREAARAFVEAREAESAERTAVDAGLAAIAGTGRDPGRASVVPVAPLIFERCQRAVFEASYEVPVLSLPFIGGFGGPSFVVRSRHSELVDPFRAGIPGSADACS